MSVTYLASYALTYLAPEGEGDGGGAAPAGNPFDGVAPQFDFFGLEFRSLWQALLGGLWALAIVFCAFKLISAGVKLQSSKKGGYSQGVMENTDDLKTWGIGTGVVLGAGIIFGAIIAAIN